MITLTFPKVPNNDYSGYIGTTNTGKEIDMNTSLPDQIINLFPNKEYSKISITLTIKKTRGFSEAICMDNMNIIGVQLPRFNTNDLQVCNNKLSKLLGIDELVKGSIFYYRIRLIK